MNQLKAVAYVRRMPNYLALIKIKQLSEENWWLFDEKDWDLDTHLPIVKAQVEAANVKRLNSRVSISLDGLELKVYFDENAKKFKFKGKYLTQANDVRYINHKESTIRSNQAGAIRIKKPLFRLKDIKFRHGIDNPRYFINKEFEKCFVEKDEEKMKFQLNKFIMKSDKASFSHVILMSDYNAVKNKFIAKYINSHLENKKRALSIKMEDYPTISSYLSQLIKNIKLYKKLDEEQICDDLMTKLPTRLASLFNIHNQQSTIDEILNYADVLDNHNQLTDISENANFVNAQDKRDEDVSPDESIPGQEDNESSDGQEVTKAHPRKNQRKTKANAAKSKKRKA